MPTTGPAPGQGPSGSGPAGDLSGESGDDKRAPQNQIIRSGYAANTPLADIKKQTGLTRNQIKGRARRMGLSSRDPQRKAVAASNRARAGK